jgi:predicted kinase
MNNWNRKRDILRERYCSEDVLRKAKEVLQKDEQSEEAFLGAQGILLLHGLI